MSILSFVAQRAQLVFEPFTSGQDLTLEEQVARRTLDALRLPGHSQSDSLSSAAARITSMTSCAFGRIEGR